MREVDRVRREADIRCPHCGSDDVIMGDYDVYFRDEDDVCEMEWAVECNGCGSFFALRWTLRTADPGIGILVEDDEEEEE